MDEEVAGLTRRSTRAALAEIPAQMGVLRESPAQNELSPNVPWSYLSPTPSPDEMVIQQRGIIICLVFKLSTIVLFL